VTATLTDTSPDEPPGRSLRRAALLTAAVGAIHSVLFILSFWLLSDVPPATASDAAIVDYYSSNSSRRLVLVGLYVMPFAGIAFIWFSVALRMWIGEHARSVSVLFSNIQLVSGIVFVGLFFAAASAFAIIAAGVEFSDTPIDPVAAREFPQYGAALLFVFAMRMAAMFVFATSTIGRHTGILPRWFTLLGYVVGTFLLLSATFSRLLALVFPLWVLMLAAILTGIALRIPRDAVLPRRGPPSEVAQVAHEDS
jgi:hypothetical protein